MKKTDSKNRQRRIENFKPMRKYLRETLTYEQKLEMLPTQNIRLSHNKRGKNVDRIPPDDIIVRVRPDKPVIRTKPILVEKPKVVIPTLQERLDDIRQRKENQRTERKNSIITDGFLYLVTSPAYPDWVKVGQTSDYENRLSTYQTASPFADYQMVAVKYVENRVLSESKFLELAKLVFEVKGEWIKASVEDLAKDF